MKNAPSERGAAAPHPGQDAGVGERIRFWRGLRGFSQMRLALDAGISPRHMSFVETGRSRPSRDVVERVARALDVPLREENVLLESAGYARRYSESRLDDRELEHVRSVFRFLLDQHEPYSALVIDQSWDIVMSNQAHQASVAFFLEGSAPPEPVASNLLHLVFHPLGLRRCIANFDVVGPVLLRRAELELSENPSADGLGAAIEAVRGYGPIPPWRPRMGAPSGVLLPVHLRRGDTEIRLFSVLGSIGTPTQVTLQELRIETFFPADDASAQVWARMTEAGLDR